VGSSVVNTARPASEVAATPALPSWATASSYSSNTGADRPAGGVPLAIALMASDGDRPSAVVTTAA
jgi:hypothetical protein